MRLREKIIKILERSTEPVSGEEMAKILGVTRNSVWKTVNVLKKDGYQISAGTNKGYQLLSAGNVLDEQQIYKFLPEKLQMLPIEVRESVTSTNTVLKESVNPEEKKEKVLIAQAQTAGKGRLGRTFESPFGTGIYLSMLLFPNCSAQEALFLTTAAAVAVSRAIEEISQRTAQIKWVNDIYLDKKKVCGILTEASVDFEGGGLHYAVVGIGINIAKPQGGFPEEVEKIATAVYEKEVPPSARAQISAAVIRHFYSIYENLPNRDYMQDYKDKSLLTGLDIVFQQGNIMEEGRVTGIDDEAKLLVTLKNGEKRAYSAGEVNIQKGFV